MLGIWMLHTDYQKKLLNTILPLFKHNPKSILHYEDAFAKMFFLNLDCVKVDFESLFSHIGRPSNQQPELFRSFLLMSHFKYASIPEWVAYASSNPIICSLIGVSPDHFPGVSTHYDFFSRLWMAKPTSKLRTIRKKPSKKFGKSKIPPKHPHIVSYLVDKALSGQTFHNLPERLYQAIFMKTAIIPSAKLNLFANPDKMIISADGTCIISHASPYGKKICACVGSCSCKRSFTDPDAKWGWDSYHEIFFHGYTAYILTAHNKDLKLDLPVYIKFVEASRNDSATLITALAHARYLYRNLFHFDSLLADAIHDNYPTYLLLKEWQIKPFIPLNGRSDNSLQSKGVVLSGNGTPVCADGHDMVNWGFDPNKYRIKYRCPYVLLKVDSCPYAESCNKTPYGKIIYVRLASNLRLLTPVPRDTEEWLKTYKQRTAAERVNNRILTDYKLEQPKRYGKKKLVFFTFLNAVNVHLDAQIKSPDAKIPDLVKLI